MMTMGHSARRTTPTRRQARLPPASHVPQTEALLVAALLVPQARPRPRPGVWAAKPREPCRSGERRACAPPPPPHSAADPAPPRSASAPRSHPDPPIAKRKALPPGRLAAPTCCRRSRPRARPSSAPHAATWREGRNARRGGIQMWQRPQRVPHLHTFWWCQ